MVLIGVASSCDGTQNIIIFESYCQDTLQDIKASFRAEALLSALYSCARHIGGKECMNWIMNNVFIGKLNFYFIAGTGFKNSAHDMTLNSLGHFVPTSRHMFLRHVPASYSLVCH